MTFSGQIYPNDTVGYFRIASATDRQPIEPVAVGEFKIGAADNCQLRLGDSQIAPVHTTLTVDREQVVLKCHQAEPPALVNGTARSECRLVDGDLLEIGDHRLLFRLVGADERITLDETRFGSESPSNTTRELVDRLEEQIELVEELSTTPDSAVMELLEAVTRTAADESNSASTVSATAAASSDLQQVTELLQRHHEASRIRLESLTEVLNNVVTQQKLIADTLEVMSGRIQALDNSNIQRRASA